ncbi:hypothetical protein G7046_g512 [Stylonectria norvegica]|nr:hypothetical protein G7046_g512 [Stylonectria norvegica]
MGWFSRNKIKKTPPSGPSFTDPPNVYAPRPSPPNSSTHPVVTPGPLQPRPQPQPHSQSQPQPQLRPPSLPYSHQYASQSQPQFSPAGYLAPPPGWNPQPAFQPVIVNHQHSHYYLGSQPIPHPPGQQHLHPQLQPQQHHSSLGRFTGSMIDLAKEVVPGNSIPQLYNDGLSAWHSTTAMYDQVSSRFDNVMTLIDNEKLFGDEKDLFSCQPLPSPAHSPPTSPPVTTDRGFGKPSSKKSSKDKSKSKSKYHASDVATCVPGSYFSKVELYANSKLSMNLPPLALYIPTWRLLCLAAQYSQRVYDNPKGAERDAHVSSDWRTGTKAMCIKSVPMDDMNTIVFAIRGTATFMDWAVNLNTAPVSPVRFLDDPGNLCHAGFMTVAKKMIRPVAARLRQLLQEDPGRSSYSLMITGHSAGGAVAALLYSHMLSTTKKAESELTILAGCFKRIHCVTFGTPPVSLLPLSKPERPELRKSLFLSFVNEGDPVVRADKAYVKSLVELLACPPPLVSVSRPKDPKDKKNPGPKKSKSMATLASSSSKQRARSSSRPPKPIWKVPPSTLSNAGRLVVLRSGDPKAKPKERKTVHERLKEGVVAVTCQDEHLRGVIWGDPVCHLMSLYAGRIEVLAVGSITARNY